MHTTSPSLLNKLRQPGEREAWNRFADLYTPLLYYWARSQGLAENDASDLVQEVFLALVVKLPDFRYESDGSFRGWLRVLTLNKHRELQRRRRPNVSPDLDDLCASSSGSLLDEREYRLQIVQRMLGSLERDFPPSTWRLFHECAVKNRKAEDVARERQVTLGTVYAAKSKVLNRLRREVGALLE